MLGLAAMAGRNCEHGQFLGGVEDEHELDRYCGGAPPEWVLLFAIGFLGSGRAMEYQSRCFVENRGGIRRRAGTISPDMRLCDWSNHGDWIGAARDQSGGEPF